MNDLLVMAWFFSKWQVEQGSVRSQVLTLEESLGLSGLHPSITEEAGLSETHIYWAPCVLPGNPIRQGLRVIGTTAPSMCCAAISSRCCCGSQYPPVSNGMGDRELLPRTDPASRPY
jgi:hypothetical protein